MSSYYIMRPIRDQMGVAGGVNNLQWLFTATMVGMLALNLPFAYLVKTLPRSRFIPLAYRFFAANILLFALALFVAAPEQTVWVGRVFASSWLSIYNLFVVSIFWQMNVDLFSPERGKRLFGIIAAGATVGAVVGSGATASLAKIVPPTGLLIGAALLLEVAVFAVGRLARLSPALHHHPSERQDRPIGGGVLSGIAHALKNARICSMSAPSSCCSRSPRHFSISNRSTSSATALPIAARQTAFFRDARPSWWCATLALQLFFTEGGFVVLIGVALALALLPGADDRRVRHARGDAEPDDDRGVSQVLRRAGDYAIARPTQRGAVHGAAARGPLQDKELYRHLFVYRRLAGRPGRRVVGGGAARARRQCLGGVLGRDAGCRAVAHKRAVARAARGGAGARGGGSGDSGRIIPT